MTAEEFIELVRAEAAEFAPEEAVRFVQAAREELMDLNPPEVSRDRSDEFAERSRIERPRPPERYMREPGLWAVYSAFLAHFLHPVGAALEIAEFASDAENPDITRFVLAAEGEVETADGISVESLENLRRDYNSLVQRAHDLGTEVFGDDFEIGDFLNPEPEFPGWDEHDLEGFPEPEGER